MPDTLNITILDDGTLKIETDKVSMPNHMNAEAFLRDMARQCGGTTERRHKHGAQAHSHDHDHNEHEHNHN